MTNSYQHSTQGIKSLLLITVDCLRADHCGLYGYSQPTTPFLDSLAAESFVVPTAIVAGAPTYYSFPAIMASRSPLALGRDVIGIAPGETTLATTLRDAGFATAGFSASNPYISPYFGYDQGFETFEDFLDFGAQPVGSIDDPGFAPEELASAKLNGSIKNLAATFGLSKLYSDLYFRYCMKIAPPVDNIDRLRKYPAADAMVDRALSWLASMKSRPFFLWLHLMDPHSPYYPSEQAFREMTGREIVPSRARYLNEYWNRSDLAPHAFLKQKDELVELYDAGIRWVDGQLARLVEGLRLSNRWNDCVFALTADHGEEFLDHGGRYHAPVRLYEELVKVPLLIRVPGERSMKLGATPMSHVHLAPTLLDIMRMPVPSSFRGRSLWTNFRLGAEWDDPAIIDCAFGCTSPFNRRSRLVPRLIGVRGSRFKLVMRIEAGATEEMYDLETDPGELQPGLEEIPAEPRKKLLRAAYQHLKTMDSPRDITMRLKSQLRDCRREMLG